MERWGAILRPSRMRATRTSPSCWAARRARMATRCATRGSTSRGMPPTTAREASPTGPGTPAATFADELDAASRMVGVSHVLVTLTTAGLPTDDIWPTDSEYQCGLSGLERQAPGVTDWQVFNEPDSNYTYGTGGVP